MWIFRLTIIKRRKADSNAVISLGAAAVLIHSWQHCEAECKMMSADHVRIVVSHKNRLSVNEVGSAGGAGQAE